MKQTLAGKLGFVQFLFAAAFVLLPAPATARNDPATFSIVAYDTVTHELGVAVQSKYFSVGDRKSTRLNSSH